jgi:hypothetical protein
MLEEERAHASSLMRISHGKRHLGVRGRVFVRVDPAIAAHAYNVLLLPFLECRNQGHIASEVQLGKVAQLSVGQGLLRLEKAKIDRPAA